MTEEMSLAWARELANALRAWCNTEGIVPSTLAKKLGISDGVWASIISGRSIARDTETYTKIYFWTRLNQADPRKIPPLKLIGALSGKESSRAWSESRLQKWMDSAAARRLEKNWKKDGKTSKTKIASIDDVESLMGRLREAISQDVLNSMSSTQLMVALRTSLNSVVNGSPSQRDEWFRANKNILVDIVPILEILSQNSESREHALKIYKRTS